MNKVIGVLFDVDGLGPAGVHDAACWRIFMKNLDLREMPGVVFYQGDLSNVAAGKPKCFCIAISDFIPATGGRGCRYFVQKMETAEDPALFPIKDRFLEGDELSSLIPAGKVDSGGCLRMSVKSGELGDLRLVAMGREFGWKVLPGEDLLPKFAINYLARKGSGTLDDQSRKLCEALLKEIGYDATMAALRSARFPAEQLATAREGLTLMIWPDKHAGQPQQAAAAKRSSAPTRRLQNQPRKWWEIWKKAG